MTKLDNVLGSNVVQGPLNFTGVHPPSGGHNLAANVLGDGGSTVEREEERSLELSLCALHFGLSDGLREASPLAEGKVDKVVNLGELVSDEVDTPETSVAVGSREGHEAVGDLVLVDEGRETRSEVGSVALCTVIVANDALGDKGGKVVGGLPGDTLNGNGNVGGGKGIVTETDFRANEVRLGTAWSANYLRNLRGLEMTKVLLGKLDEGLVGNTTSADENHAVSLVVLGNVVSQVVALDGHDVLLRSEDSAAQSLTLEGSSVEMVENNLLELLVNLLLLTEDDGALALNSRLFEFRVLKDIGKNLDGLGSVILEGFGKVYSVFALSKKNKCPCHN